MSKRNAPKIAITIASLAAASMAGCSSISLPNIDLMGGESDFSEDVANLDQSFPSTDETPELPTDVRTAEAWDESAKELLALQEDFDVPSVAPALSDDEFDREFERAQAEANAYKEYDPQ